MINDREMLRLIDKEGKSQSDAAKAMGVSRQAVSKRLQELRGRTTRVIVAKQTEQVLEQSFDAGRQLCDINQRTLELLDEAEENREFSLKCVAELRNQIRLAMEIQERIYSQQEARKFMELIISVLKDVSPDAYKEFRTRINDEQSIRSVLHFS